MKIIHVVEAFGGGVIDFIYYLTKELDHHEHTIIYAPRGEIDIKVKFPESVKFVTWPNAQREISLSKDFKASRVLLKLLKSMPYDVVHLHSSKAGFLGRMIAPFLRNKNILYTPNGASFARLDISSKKKRVLVLAERIASWAGGRVVACSESESKLYHQYKMKATFVSNGIAVGRAPDHPNSDTNRPLQVITAGRLSPQKNPSLFNDIAELLKEESQVEFTWLGDGEQRDAISSPNVTLAGWIPKPEVLQRVAKADLYISSALWEGLPFAVLDAMNLGKPLLLREAVGNVDLVESGKNGYIYKTPEEGAQYIRKLLQDRTLITKMGEYSYQLLGEKFDAKGMAKAYEQEYKNGLK